MKISDPLYTNFARFIRVLVSFCRSGQKLNRGLKSLLLGALLCLALGPLNACCRSDDVPELMQRLNSRTAKDRNDAALALARCGGKAENAVPRLAQLLYDENVGVQSAASYALRKIDTPPARAVLLKAEASRR